MTCTYRTLGLFFSSVVAVGLVFAPVEAQDRITVIENGRVLDGSGNPWKYANVAIQGDRIIRIGDTEDLRPDRIIDASGFYVTPGFIDVHSHAGSALASPWLGLNHAKPLLAMGLTTVFVNPDGGGL